MARFDPPDAFGSVVRHGIGFFGGLMLLTYDYLLELAGGPRLPTAQWRFIQNPKAMVWLFLIVAQFAFWADVWTRLRWWNRQLVEPLTSTKNPSRFREFAALFQDVPPIFMVRLFFSVLMFAVPPVVFRAWDFPIGLAHHGWKLTVVNVISLVVAMKAVIGLWRIRSTLEAQLPAYETSLCGDAQPEYASRIEPYLHLRIALQRFITVLGVMIGLATLAKGALRNAFLATGPQDAKDLFPSELVLLQGMYFTAALAMVYIPTFNRLGEVGSALVDAAFPFTEANLAPEKISSWHASRKSFEELLQLKAGVLENLQASLSIMAPLTGGLVSYLGGSSK